MSYQQSVFSMAKGSGLVLMVVFLGVNTEMIFAVISVFCQVAAIGISSLQIGYTIYQDWKKKQP